MDLIESRPGILQRHPWEIARLQFFAQIVGDCLPSSDGIFRILDIGSGDGWFSRQLASVLRGDVEIVCCDSGYTDSLLASDKLEQHPSVRYVSQPPPERFDLILLMDVLEHVEDDASFLSRLVSSHLNESGYALISVPAWPILFSAHDRYLKHFRRYTPVACRALLAKSGLAPLQSSGLFHSLFWLRLLQKILPRSNKENSDLGPWNAPAPITSAILHMLRIDAAVSRSASRLFPDFPGLSYWAL